nr:flagellar hook capping FlgD N-terminal domain-containing protein [uncultured Desulfuromonas sp.]
MSVTSATETSSTSSPTYATASSNTLGQDDFLELLIAQLQHQDPLEPQSNTEFIAQLATFSSLEQQTMTNDKLDGVLASTSDMQQLAAIDMLDQVVVAQSDNFYLNGDQVDVGFYLPEDATSVTVNVLDEDDNVVATIERTDLDAGDHFLEWDGMDKEGNPLPEGEYGLEVEAYSADGKIDNVLPLIKTTVDEVAMTSSGSVLSTDAGEILLSSIYSVESP